MRYVRTIEELERGVILAPRCEVGPYSIRKYGLQNLEDTRRGPHAFPAAGQRTSGQNEADNVVEMRVTNKETTSRKVACTLKTEANSVLTGRENKLDEPKVHRREWRFD